MSKGSLFTLHSVDTVTLVKALAISLIVANHAVLDRMFLHGGLNALLLVSGMVFASFAFQGTTAQTLQMMKRLSLRIAIPAVLLSLIWNMMTYLFSADVSEIKWLEHVLLSNWFYKSRIALFPLWYVQVLVQIMLALGLVFWLFNLTPHFKANPVRASLIALALSLGLAMLSYGLWDTASLHDKLPHLLLWNLTLGWVFWAFRSQPDYGLRSKLILSALLLGSEILIFIICGAVYGEVRIISLTLMGLLIIWIDSVSLPQILTRIVLLISQAIFFIFLFLFFNVYRRQNRL